MQVDDFLNRSPYIFAKCAQLLHEQRQNQEFVDALKRQISGLSESDSLCLIVGLALECLEEHRPRKIGANPDHPPDHI
jgi:hypothetical protein